MKPVWVIILGWILLVPRVGTAGRGPPEEASFFYGTFPPGMSMPPLFCPCCLSVYLSMCRSLLVFLPWLTCQRIGIGCFGFLSRRMGKTSM